jgi:hypothetical protein
MFPELERLVKTTSRRLDRALSCQNQFLGVPQRRRVSGMKIDMKWDVDAGVVDINYTAMNVVDEASFTYWRSGLMREFRRCKLEAGGKFPLIVNIDELKIDPEFAERYSSEVAAVVAAQFATAIARYGSRATTRVIVAIEAAKRSRAKTPHGREKAFKANIFDTREAAISFVRAAARG